jgi:hypothetical protein
LVLPTWHRTKIRSLEQRLAVPAVDAVFDEGEIAELEELVQGYFGAAIAAGTPIARAARIAMRGHIKLGARWIPFRASEILAPHKGFIWASRAAGVIAGSDHYVDGHRELDWKLLGIFRVAHADGPDVARSAAARGAGEAVWLPTALLPRFGVGWHAEDEHHLVATYKVDDLNFSERIDIDDAGLLRSASFRRWGDPGNTGEFDWHVFGMSATGHATFAGLTIPSTGRAGWHHGTKRWPEGEFFRYRITGLQPIV